MRERTESDRDLLSDDLPPRRYSLLCPQIYITNNGPGLEYKIRIEQLSPAPLGPRLSFTLQTTKLKCVEACVELPPGETHVIRL